MRNLHSHRCLIWTAAVLALAVMGSCARAEEEHPAGEAVESHAASISSVEGARADPDYDQPPLIPKVMMFVFTLLLFGLFVIGMPGAVWGPLIQALNAREGRIAKAEADARAARLEIEQLTASVERRLAEVQEQVNAIVLQARTEAESQKLEIVAQAEKDARRIKDNALAEIAAARSEALSKLDQTVDRQVEMAFEHLVG